MRDEEIPGTTTGRMAGTVTVETASFQKVAENRTVGCLIYVSEAGPGDTGRSFSLTEGEMTIGRDDTCDIVLNDDSISRRHVKLSTHKKGILVEDLGSKNGTTYLGKEIKRAIMRVGSRLGIGNCYIELLPLPGPDSVPVSVKSSYGGLFGASLPMRRLYALLEALEGSDVPVLIEGETGTGKELAARALHDHGLRRDKPFMVIDCGAIPEKLIESELFGYRKGAFTGAAADHVGAFEAASGGTVFIDEIDDLPLELQPKLLRVLETRQIKRLGDSVFTPIDIRVIVASKRSLAEEVAQGRFREDLYYRIAVIRLEMPPLRQRIEDIPLLVKHILEQLPGADGDMLSPESLELLMRHDWPGNVRELRNKVQMLSVLGTEHFQDAPATTSQASPEPRMSPRDLPSINYRQAREQVLREFDRAYLEELMKRFQGNQSRAAKAAGISRRYLRDMLKKHGL